MWHCECGQSITRTATVWPGAWRKSLGLDLGKAKTFLSRPRPRPRPLWSVLEDPRGQGQASRTTRLILTLLSRAYWSDKSEWYCQTVHCGQINLVRYQNALKRAAKWVQAVNEMGASCDQSSVESWLVQPIKELSSVARRCAVRAVHRQLAKCVHSLLPPNIIIIIIIHEFHGDTSLKQNFRAADPKGIYMNCPDVTLRCIKSQLYHVVSLSTCKVFLNLFLMFVFIAVLHALSISTVYMYTCYMWN